MKSKRRQTIQTRLNLLLIITFSLINAGRFSIQLGPEALPHIPIQSQVNNSANNAPIGNNINYGNQPNSFLQNPLQGLSSFLSKLSLMPQYNTYPMSYPPSNYPVGYGSPFARGLSLETSDQKNKKLAANEIQKLENFFAQFIIISQRHTFNNYYKLKVFYEKYLLTAEEAIKLNHQEYLYLSNLNKYIFAHNLKAKTLDVVEVKKQLHIIMMDEENQVIINIQNNESFKPRSDYFDLIKENEPRLKTSSQKKSGQKKFLKDYSQLKKALKLEQEWHDDLKQAKRRHVSQIRKRELKRQISHGQGRIRRLLRQLQRYLENQHGKKSSKEVRQKIKSIKYLLEMIYEHRMGLFFSRVSSYYFDFGMNEHKKPNTKQMAKLEKKAYYIRKNLSPLAFYVSVYRVLQQYRHEIKAKQAKILKSEDLPKKISKLLKDPREKIICKIYFQVLLQRLVEIDFFLFDNAKQYFSLDPQKILQAILNNGSLKEFVQFNANLDLLFVQVAKIEAHLNQGNQLQTLPEIRQKYFKFFVLLIQPMVSSKEGFNLVELEKTDKKFFSEIKKVKAYKKLINNHLKDQNKIGDVDISQFQKDAVFGDSVEKYLESDKHLQDDDSDASGDFFYGSDRLKNRHKGSEISSEVDNSEIKEMQRYEMDLKENNMSLKTVQEMEHDQSKKSNSSEEVVVTETHHETNTLSIQSSKKIQDINHQNSETSLRHTETSQNDLHSKDVESVSSHDIQISEKTVDMKQFETSDGEVSSIEKVEIKTVNNVNPSLHSNIPLVKDSLPKNIKGKRS